MKTDRTLDEYELLEATALRPLRYTSRMWYAWVAFLGMILAFGLYAYIHQLRYGLGVTGMNDKVSWGIYIVNFVFLIGISHAGTLISAILRVTHAEWRRPITRMAEVITGVALMVGGIMPILDLGSPGNIPNLLFFGRAGSPVIWDFISITTYLTGSLIYLFLPLIPDIARCRDRLGPDTSRWRKKLYKVLSVGWKNTPEQHRRLERALNIMMIVIIPVAISVHTVVSWIFSMTMRVGWDSTIFGPYFVVGAIFSGVAGIITVMAIFRKIYGLERYITVKHFKHLGSLLLALTLFYIYFTFSEYLTIGYKLTEHDEPLLEALLLGEYALPFWIFAIAGTIIPALMLALPKTRTVKGIVIASVLINIGMWLKRFVIVIPSMAAPLMPYDWGVYNPTWVEYALTAAAFAGFALIFTLFAKVFPIISMWEIEEGWEHAALLKQGGEGL